MGVREIREAKKRAILASLRDAIATAIARDPQAQGIERVVLFGSWARDDWDGYSDIDLMVFGQGWLRRRHLADTGCSVDIIHTRRSPIAFECAPGDDDVIDTALREGIVLYPVPDGVVGPRDGDTP